MAEARYKIYEQLGAGGNGAVFRAYDTQLKRWVAIKRLITAADDGGRIPTTEELRREADTLASLRNSSIVTIFDVATDEEGLFMVMELLEGPDLADTIQSSPLGQDDFKQLAEQTLEGLLAAHQLRILHRDIKPENIKVERLPGGRLQAKLIDFGLARSGLGARKQTEDQSGSVMGSIYYMAPEQLSRQPVDARTDLYALGCVLYEAISGRKPFDGKSVNEVIDKHLDHDVVPLGQMCPHLPHWLTYWVMRLMACRPDDRPATAQQAIEEFRAWEKLPPAPGMMPWMPQGYGYATAPIYTTQVPLPGYPPNVTTGHVPVHTTGYYPTVPPTTTAIPIPEDIPYAQPLPASPPAQAPGPKPIGPRKPSPAAPAGRKPGSSGKTASSSSATTNGKKKMIFIGVGAALVIGIILFFTMGGSNNKPAAPGSVTPAPSAPGGPSEANEQLFPQGRPYPVADLGRVVHYVASVGTRKPDGKATDSGSSVSMWWDDLAGRAKNTPLKASDASSSPGRVKWQDAQSNLIKPDRLALRFSSPGNPASMNAQWTEQLSDQFPFGSKSVIGQLKGMTLGLVFQVDAAAVPARIMTLASADGSESVVLRANPGGEVVAELTSKSGKQVLTAAKSDARKPVAVLIQWDAASSEVSLKVRDAAAAVISATGNLAVPASPLFKLAVGRTKDGNGAMVPSAEQFHGFLGDLVVYATSLKQDQVAILLRDLADFYLQKPKPKPLSERYTKRKPIDGDPKAWKLSADVKSGDVGRVVDGDTASTWSTGAAQAPGTWFQIDLGSTTDVGGILLDSESKPTDYPRAFKVESSFDGNAWASVVESGKGKAPITEVLFPAKVSTRFLKITLTGQSGSHWQICELLVVKP
ncbi:MAG: protein kinase [Verrucomicrobiaceae bacterium]|nr:protein kinase [Verrucomicrobiaceae bacterium]